MNATVFVLILRTRDENETVGIAQGCPVFDDVPGARVEVRPLPRIPKNEARLSV